ncbi:MAG: ABC transporter ATP-binding protein [Clostridia bacterium]|nr:ABC transporter ATP-binding protein [Clostridia bacterium]
MILTIDRLTFSFDDAPLLRDLSLNVDAGEIVCLLGPNGSGKTTLLDCILGFHRPTAGSVTLCGKEIGAYSRAQLAKCAAYVPQQHTPTFPYTVREAVRMGRTAHAGLLGAPNKEDEAICEQALRQVGMEAFADRPYTSLSGGELKLVLLARALSQKARLLVLDEPTASLDFKNEMRFLETLARLARQEQIGILMATHALQHAFYFESQALPVNAVLLSRGKPAITGTPQALLTPQTLAEIYGVRAAVHEVTGEHGETMRSLTLFGSMEEQ